MRRIGIVLLAAGTSTRFGSPKQLTAVSGVSLLRRAAEAALLTPCRPVVVVLGAFHESCAQELHSLDIKTLINSTPERGMSSSIRAGLEWLIHNDPVDAVLFMLCDQPTVSHQQLNNLIDCYLNDGWPIVAAGYSGGAGVPAILDSRYFDELRMLEGERGAHQIINRNLDTTSIIAMPEAALDIDTPENLHDFLQQTSGDL